MKGLNARKLTDELMDQPGICAKVHIEALRAIGRVNGISGIHRILWGQICKFQPTPSTPLRILDVACGGADVTLKLAQQASRLGLPFTFEGTDISHTAVEFASSKAKELKLKNVHFHQHDALHSPFQKTYDVVMSSLFMHHLSNPQAVLLLERMSAVATRGIILDDLRRTRLGYFLAWCGVRLLTRSKMVHFDGPVSVEAGFQTEEARGLATQAGLSEVSFRQHWPQRFLMTWKRPENEVQRPHSAEEMDPSDFISCPDRQEAPLVPTA